MPEPLCVATLPATVVLKPVSAIKISPLVLSITPAPLPERIWLCATLSVEVPAAAAGPNRSEFVMNAAPPVNAIEGVEVEVGQVVAPRPWNVPLLSTTGTPVPPPTLRKLTLSKITPEPLPVFAMLSELPVPCAYATLSDKYNCWKPEPVKLIALPIGALMSMACIDTTPPLRNVTLPLIVVAKLLPATVLCRCTPPVSTTFSLYVPGRTRIVVGFDGPNPSATAALIAA